MPLSLLLDKGSAGSQLKDRDLGIGKAQEEVLLPSFPWGEFPHNVPASDTSLLHLPKQKDNLGALVLVRAQEMSQQWARHEGCGRCCVYVCSGLFPLVTNRLCVWAQR